MSLKRIKQFWWVAVLAGLAVWAGLLAYYTFFPPKTPYRKEVETIAELLGGVKAKNLSEAREILEQVNQHLREPARDQRLYVEIKIWLREMKNGNLSPEDRKLIVTIYRAQSGDKDLTWEDIEKTELHRAEILLDFQPEEKLNNLKAAAKALENRMIEIEKQNAGEYNRDLDRFLNTLKDPAAQRSNPALLDEINEFLTEKVPERARRCPLFSETTVVPFLVEMLDDEKPTKRSRLYDVIVRIVAKARTEDITATEPSREAIGEVKTRILPYDPDAPSDERRAAMDRMRKWLNSGDNKKIYNP